MSEMDMCFFMTFVAKVLLSLLRVIKITLPNMPSPSLRPSAKSSWSFFVLSQATICAAGSSVFTGPVTQKQQRLKPMIRCCA